MAQVPLMLQVRRQHGQQLEIAVLVSTGLPRQPAADLRSGGVFTGKWYSLDSHRRHMGRVELSNVGKWHSVCEDDGGGYVCAGHEYLSQTPGSTMTYPGANTIGVANTGNTAWRTPLYSDITALFGSGSCSGALMSSGGCTALPSVGTWGALNYPTWASGTPFVKMTAAGTFALDTNTYRDFRCRSRGHDNQPALR
jgi:hypothetical protein